MFQESDVRAKKHLGQHFLKDASFAVRIAEALSPSACSGRVLEIGPGTGALTRPLLERLDEPPYGLELDQESVAFLVESKTLPADHVLEQDLLKWSPSDHPAFRDEPFALVGNFPYNISSQILFWTLDHRGQIPELVGMFQKEVAERVVAPHGSKTYGILSVLIQLHYDGTYLFTVPPGAFNPPPKVQSGVIRLARKASPPEQLDYGHLKAVVKAAFNQRRKTLRNALRSGGFDVSAVPEATLGLRAEQLSPDELATLARLLPSR